MGKNASTSKVSVPEQGMAGFEWGTLGNQVVGKRQWRADDIVWTVGLSKSLRACYMLDEQGERVAVWPSVSEAFAVADQVIGYAYPWTWFELQIALIQEDLKMVFCLPDGGTAIPLDDEDPNAYAVLCVFEDDDIPF